MSVFQTSLKTSACLVLFLFPSQGDRQPHGAVMAAWSAAQETLVQELLPGERSPWFTRLEQVSSQVLNQVTQLIFLQLTRSEKWGLKLSGGGTLVSRRWTKSGDVESEPKTGPIDLPAHVRAASWTSNQQD